MTMTHCHCHCHCHCTYPILAAQRWHVHVVHFLYGQLPCYSLRPTVCAGQKRLADGSRVRCGAAIAVYVIRLGTEQLQNGIDERMSAYAVSE